MTHEAHTHGAAVARRMTKRPNRGNVKNPGIDYCKVCGSTELFDSDTEDGREGETVTVCLDCGQQQDRPY